MSLEFDVKIINEMRAITCSLDERLSNLSDNFTNIRENLSKIRKEVENVSDKLDEKRTTSHLAYTVTKSEKPSEPEPDQKAITTEKMERIMKILSTHIRLENGNFQIFRVGTDEFASIGQINKNDDPKTSEVSIETASELPAVELPTIEPLSELDTTSSESDQQPEFSIPKFTNEISALEAQIFEKSSESSVSVGSLPPVSSEPAPPPATPRRVHFQETNVMEELSLRRQVSLSSSSESLENEPNRPKFLNKSRVNLGRKRRPPSRKILKINLQSNDSDEEIHAPPNVVAPIVAEDSSDIDTDDLFE